MNDAKLGQELIETLEEGLVHHEPPYHQLALTIITPERQLAQVQAQWVELPAESGLMRALPNHAPTLGTLGVGKVRFLGAAGGEKQVEVGGGFFEVLGDRVTILATQARLA